MTWPAAGNPGAAGIHSTANKAAVASTRPAVLMLCRFEEGGTEGTCVSRGTAFTG